MSTDRIELRGLRAYGYHGCFDHERRDGQEFLVDVTLWLDFSGAAATDDLTRTVHYGELAEQVVQIIAGPPRNLIETVCSEIADAVMADTRIAATEVVVHKPSAPIPHAFEDVRVVTQRSRSEPTGDASGPPAAHLPAPQQDSSGQEYRTAWPYSGNGPAEAAEK